MHFLHPNGFGILEMGLFIAAETRHRINFHNLEYILFDFSISNQLGCTLDTFTKKITLGSVPHVDFNLSAACTNSPVLFSDSSHSFFGDPVAWSWNFNDESFSKEKNPVASFNTSGIKKISLSVRTNLGCVADTFKLIDITEKPGADFSFVEDCNGTVVFSPSVTNNMTIERWSWQFATTVFLISNWLLIPIKKMEII